MAEIETFDFPRVDVGFFTDRLRDEMRDDMAKNRIPAPMLGIGRAGIGKTEGIRSIAKELGIGMLEMRLVNYTETDLIGIPFLNKDGRTEHGTNVLFPSEERDGKYGILLVDEFTSASRNIQVPILQLTDTSRSVGQYKLPDGWKVVLAGNGPNDGGTFTNLPGTVISRASCYYVDPSHNSWLEWAAKNNIHPAIRAYVKFKPSAIHGYVEDESTGYDRAFPCPRSWTNLSVILTDYYERYKDWTRTDASFNAHADIAEILVASKIGISTARDFISFIRFEQGLIDPMKIILASKPEDRAKLPRLEDMHRELAYLQIANLADTLASIVNTDGMFDIINRTIDRKCVLAVANAYNWVLETASPTGELATFAAAELSGAFGGVAVWVLQNKEFLAACPNFKKLKAGLNSVFRA